MTKHKRSTPDDERTVCIDPKYNENRVVFVEDFCRLFRDRYPKHVRLYNRASYLWSVRGELRREAEAAAELKRALDHTVYVPAVIKNKTIGAPVAKLSNYPECEELLAKQNNLIAESVLLQKEQIELMKEQNALFKSLASTKQKKDDEQ